MTITTTLYSETQVCLYETDRDRRCYAFLAWEYHRGDGLQFTVYTPHYTIHFTRYRVLLCVSYITLVFQPGFGLTPPIHYQVSSVSKAGAFTIIQHQNEVIFEERIRLRCHLWKLFTLRKRRQRLLRERLLRNLLPPVLITFIL